MIAVVLVEIFAFNNNHLLQLTRLWRRRLSGGGGLLSQRMALADVARRHLAI